MFLWVWSMERERNTITLSYSDDTAEHLFAGQPTVRELAQYKMRTPTCDSCRQQAPTTQITYGDGAAFWLCDGCRPFDVSKVTVVDITIDYDKETT